MMPPGIQARVTNSSSVDEVEEEYLAPILHDVDHDEPPIAQSLQQQRQQLSPPQPSSTIFTRTSNSKQQQQLKLHVTNPNGRSFRRTKLFHIVNTLSEMARLGLAVYGVDLFKIVLLGAGFDIPKSNRVTHAFAYFTYTIWMFQRVSTFKRYVLHKIYKHRSAVHGGRRLRNGEIVTTPAGNDDRGRIQLADRLLDAGLILLTAFVLLEILNVEFGVAVKGVVAVGSVWTLVVSLAMKEIVRCVLIFLFLSMIRAVRH